MKAEGIDAMVATSAENVTYSSGYWALSQWIRRGPQIYVLLPAADLAASEIIASTTLLDQIADQDDVWIANVRRYGYFQVDRSNVPLDALDSGRPSSTRCPTKATPSKRWSRRSSGRAVAVAASPSTKWDCCRDIGRSSAANFRTPSWWPASSCLRRVRAVKTVEEIARLRRVAHITEASVDAALALPAKAPPKARWRAPFMAAPSATTAFR